MGRIAWLLCAVICACSGDDSHRHTRTPRPLPTPEPAAAAPAGATFTEASVASYWTTPDEIAAGHKFDLEDYKAAAAAFTRARAAAKDELQAARIELMLGICYERLDDAT